MKGVALGLLVVAVLVVPAGAHDLERTRVTLTFADDGAFVLDIANDPNWLLLRLATFAHAPVPPALGAAERDARIAALGAVLIDRVVLWVDGREVRPESAEYLPADATFRLRGRMPLDARSLRWMYGAVIDPYPLITRRADGRTQVELIDGWNWSGTIDLSHQFKPTRWAGIDHVVLLVAAFIVAILLRTLNAVRPRASAGRSARIARSAPPTGG